MNTKRDTRKVRLCFCHIQTDLMQITLGDIIFIIVQAQKNKAKRKYAKNHNKNDEKNRKPHFQANDT